jgi:hypothetical protein
MRTSMLSRASSQSLAEALLPAPEVMPLDMREEMLLRTEQRGRVAAEGNFTKLRRQQTGRGLTIALATPDDEVRTASSAALPEADQL